MIVVVHNRDKKQRIAFDTKRVVSVVESPADGPGGCYIVIEQGYKGAIEETFDEMLSLLSKK